MTRLPNGKLCSELQGHLAERVTVIQQCHRTALRLTGHCFRWIIRQEMLFAIACCVIVLHRLSSLLVVCLERYMPRKALELGCLHIKRLVDPGIHLSAV